jgi:two-component system chemotaxis sensor kinase CheA
MDVVRSSIESVGGSVDVESTRGEGSTLTLRLPLSLAIISSLVVESGGQPFAIPQVNLEEVVRVRVDEGDRPVEFVNGQPVYRLRDAVLPLVFLDDVLACREGVQRAALEARMASAAGLSDLLFAVVRVGIHRFGIVVDRALGSEEIVVKPNHPLLKELCCFVGATILGNGTVALILDIPGIAAHARLTTSDMARSRTVQGHGTAVEQQQDLLFTVDGEDRFLVSLGLVARIVPIPRAQLQRCGDVLSVDIDGINHRVLDVHRHLGGPGIPDTAQELILILPRHIRRPIGILAYRILDVHQLDRPLDADLHELPAVVGSTVVAGRVALYLDMFALARIERPEWFRDHDLAASSLGRALFVDDAAIFRKTVRGYLEQVGLDVVVACDGREALGLLQRDEQGFDLIVSDLEMPELDGFGFISAAREFLRARGGRHVPALALSSLNSPRDRQRALDCGFDRYELKLDALSLREAVLGLLGRTDHPLRGMAA